MLALYKLMYHSPVVMEMGERWTRGCLPGVFSLLLLSSIHRTQTLTTHPTHETTTTTKPSEESSSTTTTTTTTTTSSSSLSSTEHEQTASSSNNSSSTTPTQPNNSKTTVAVVVTILVVVIIVVVVAVVYFVRKRQTDSDANDDSSSDTRPKNLPRLSTIERYERPRNDVIEMTSHSSADDNDVYSNTIQPRADVSAGDDVRGSPDSIYVNVTGAVSGGDATLPSGSDDEIYSNQTDMNNPQWHSHSNDDNGETADVFNRGNPSFPHGSDDDIYSNEPDMNNLQWRRDSSTYLNPEDMEMIGQVLINRAAKGSIYDVCGQQGRPMAGPS